jgi:hypothetical protein
MIKNKTTMIKRIIFLLTYCVLFQYCSNEKKDQETKTDSLFQVPTSKYFSIEKYVNENIQSYVDSLNNYSSEKKLPYFLYDINFDYRDTLLNGWNQQTFISRRLETFKRVNNKLLLNKIIEDPNLRKPLKEFKDKVSLPSDIVSNHDLAKMRLIEIENHSDTLSRISSW